MENRMLYAPHIAPLRALLAVCVLAIAGCTMTKPAAKPQMPQTFLLFFPASSADLTPDAHAIVDQAAEKAKQLKPSTIAIAGYVYNVGDPKDNERMAARRVDAVEKAMVADGVDPKLFLRLPLGAPEDSVGQTGDRRIEIRLQFSGS
jgi:outer membrane protein OmpA-like peptidoglycan-associated protein